MDFLKRIMDLLERIINFFENNRLKKLFYACRAHNLSDLGYFLIYLLMMMMWWSVLGSASLGQVCYYCSYTCGCTSANTSFIVSYCLTIVDMFPLWTCLLCMHAPSVRMLYIVFLYMHAFSVRMLSIIFLVRMSSPRAYFLLSSIMWTLALLSVLLFYC